MLQQAQRRMAMLVNVVACVCMLGLAGCGSAGAKPDGVYQNPPLYADFPDPDIIRVGENFYFATTTFANSPGLTILRSPDLLHWTYVSHVVPRLDGNVKFDLADGGAYRGGIFAPSLRHHNGIFYVAVTPVGQNTRIYSSKQIEGPWSMKTLDREAFDPALYFDTDGKGYIATSGGWDGTITLLTLNSDYSAVADARKIHYHKGAEGSKLVKRGDYYYLFNALPSKLALVVSRAKNLFGPWETRAQIDDTSGGHQGAIVDLPDGSWYGFVMVDAGAIGRMTNISPMFWVDDWPVWGTPDQPGRVPKTAAAPIPGKPAIQPATSDQFDAPRLGLQWQWNHNPDNARWSLSERPGFLRLRPTLATGFWSARNTLTQKGYGPRSRGEVILDVGKLLPGDVCGFGTLGKFNAHIAVTRAPGGGLVLGMNVIEDTKDGQKTEVRVADLPYAQSRIHLRTDMDFRSERGELAFSANGKSWQQLGGSFKLAYDWRTGTFQGPQYAVFCHSPQPSEGYIDVDEFRLTFPEE